MFDPVHQTKPDELPSLSINNFLEIEVWVLLPAAVGTHGLPRGLAGNCHKRRRFDSRNGVSPHKLRLQPRLDSPILSSRKNF